MKKYSDRQVINAVKRALEFANDERNSALEIRRTFGDAGAAFMALWTAYGIEWGLELMFYELTKKDSRLRNGHRNIPYAQQTSESEDK